MASDTATLALNGEIFLEDFVSAIEQFQKLMVGLECAVVGSERIEWRIEGLESGSAIITLRGAADSNPQEVRSVVRAYETVAKTASRGQPIPFGEAVRKPLARLRSLVNGRITSLRLETDRFDAELTGQEATKATTGKSVYGAVEGRVQSLSSRGLLRFTLYDAADDYAISCYLRDGSEDVMRNAWGRLVSVEGRIKRNPETGRVSTVRDVTETGVIILEEDGDWRDAIGCAPALVGPLSPEEAIRRGRDE